MLSQYMIDGLCLERWGKLWAKVVFVTLTNAALTNHLKMNCLYVFQQALKYYILLTRGTQAVGTLQNKFLFCRCLHFSLLLMSWWDSASDIQTLDRCGKQIMVMVCSWSFNCISELNCGRLLQDYGLQCALCRLCLLYIPLELALGQHL